MSHRPNLERYTCECGRPNIRRGPSGKTCGAKECRRRRMSEKSKEYSLGLYDKHGSYNPVRWPRPFPEAMLTSGRYSFRRTGLRLRELCVIAGVALEVMSRMLRGQYRMSPEVRARVDVAFKDRLGVRPPGPRW